MIHSKRSLFYASISLVSNLTLYIFTSSLLSQYIDCFIFEEVWNGPNLFIIGILVIPISLLLWGFLFYGLLTEYQKWLCPIWFFWIYLGIATVFAIINVLCGWDCIRLWMQKI